MKKIAFAMLALAAGAALAQTSLDTRTNVYRDDNCADPGALSPVVLLGASQYCSLAHGGCSFSGITNGGIQWTGPNTSTAAFQMNSITIDAPQGMNYYYTGTGSPCHPNSTIASPFGEGISNVDGSNRVLIPTQSGGVDVCTVRDPSRFKVILGSGLDAQNCQGSGDSCSLTEKTATWEFANDMVRFVLNSGFNVHNDSTEWTPTQWRAYSDGGGTAVVTFNYQCTTGGSTYNNSVSLPVSLLP